MRKGEASAAAKRIADQLDGDLLLVFTNTSARQVQFMVYPTFQGVAARSCAAWWWRRDLPRRDRRPAGLQHLLESPRQRGNIHLALEEAFDVEPVTRDFFREYKRVFEKTAKERITGSWQADTEARHRFVQTLFNRLMFVYFISRKGMAHLQG